MLSNITDISLYMDRLDELDEATLQEILSLATKLEKCSRREKSQDKFLNFVKGVWPTFIEGQHHKMMAEAFERVVSGKSKRLIINMPPRHTKSEFASHLLPAWFLGKYPNKKIIQTSHTAELAVGFGRKVRDLIGSSEYKDIFPQVDLKADAKAAGRWSTNFKGEYFAVGVGGAVTGRGADLLIIDDPHSEQEGQTADPHVFDKVYEWYTSGPRQRLQPGGAIVIVMTRWNKADLTGKIIKKSIEEKGVDEWEVIELPAILPSGNPLWPGFWSADELNKIKNELPASKWNAQYQQKPAAGTSSIIKKEWWQEWDYDEPPECDFIIQSWDTAFTKSSRSDYSACTTWGVFYMDGPSGRPQPNIILLDAMKDRMEFPELKERAYEMYARWQPDSLIVEGKAAGLPLVYEMRQRGIPVQEYSPSRGNDKIVRVNAVSDLFASGVVWAPTRKFAEEVVEEFSDFPVGEHDDLVDSSTQALIRFRQGGFVSLDTDMDEGDYFEPVRASYY